MKLPRLLTDLDPRHLSARPFLCLLAGFALFFVSGWFLVMELGASLWWAAVLLAGLLLMAVAVRAAVQEKREQDDSEEAGA